MEVRLQGSDPRARVWSEADGRAEAWPPLKLETDLGWINSGTLRPGMYPGQAMCHLWRQTHHVECRRSVK